MLENLDRESGRRFYVGSKTECFIEEIDGLPRIVSSKTGLPYYGSSSCPLMKEDMKNQHRLKASVLEEVPDKKFLLEKEDVWINKLNAVDSPEFYNIAYAKIGGHSVDQTAMYNMYGETIVEYGKARSTINRRNNTAKRFGFDNVGDFSIWIYNQLKEGKNSAQIAEMIGWERHSPRRYISDSNMEKCIEEYDENNLELRTEIRMLIAKGVSAKRIAVLLELEIPTVCLYIGDYEEIYKKGYLVAQRAGFTKDEMEVKITKMILDGSGFNEVSRVLGINQSSVKRYFLRCVRDRLKSSDL